MVSTNPLDHGQQTHYTVKAGREGQNLKIARIIQIVFWNVAAYLKRINTQYYIKDEMKLNIYH